MTQIETENYLLHEAPCSWSLTPANFLQGFITAP